MDYMVNECSSGSLLLSLLLCLSEVRSGTSLMKKVSPNATTRTIAPVKKTLDKEAAKASRSPSMCCVNTDCIGPGKLF